MPECVQAQFRLSPAHCGRGRNESFCVVESNVADAVAVFRHGERAYSLRASMSFGARFARKGSRALVFGAKFSDSCRRRNVGMQAGAFSTVVVRGVCSGSDDCGGSSFSPSACGNVRASVYDRCRIIDTPRKGLNGGTDALSVLRSSRVEGR